MNRNILKKAPYNPRKISESNRKKLKSFILGGGLLQPAVVWNEATGNIVSGHQRIDILDSYYRTDNYEITVSIVNLSEKDEITANVKLNNLGLMGEWDEMALMELKQEWPDIDMEKDFGFDKLDLEYMFSEDLLSLNEITENAYKDLNEIKQHSQEDIEKMKAMKANERKNRYKGSEAREESYDSKYDDYAVTIIFETTKDKHNFMKAIKKKPDEKYLKASVLKDIYNQIYEVK
jgi:hypothetical protein